MPGPRKPRKAKNQAIAEEKALLAGTLPPEDRRADERREDDRRAPEPEPVVEPAVEAEAAPVAPPAEPDAPPAPPAPIEDAPPPVVEEAPAVVEPVVVAAPAPVIANDDLHVIRQRADGKKVNARGQLLD